MTRPSWIAQGVGAGVGVVLVDLWPVLAVWRAGASGSVGDLSEVQLLWVAGVYSVVLGVLAGRAMVGALAFAARSPALGRLDPWGAYALGLGVYNLALITLPGIMYALLLADENQSLRARAWLVYLLWIAGHVAAAVIAFLAARRLLGTARDRTGRDHPAPA